MLFVVNEKFIFVFSKAKTITLRRPLNDLYIFAQFHPVYDISYTV